MRLFPVALIAAAAGLIYWGLSPSAYVSEQESDDAGLEIVDSPENIKTNSDDFRSGADVDFDLSAYFEDLFFRVSAYTEAEINYFADVWGQ